MSLRAAASSRTTLLTNCTRWEVRWGRTGFVDVAAFLRPLGAADVLLLFSFSSCRSYCWYFFSCIRRFLRAAFSLSAVDIFSTADNSSTSSSCSLIVSAAGWLDADVDNGQATVPRRRVANTRRRSTLDDQISGRFTSAQKTSIAIIQLHYVPGGS